MKVKISLHLIIKIRDAKIGLKELVNESGLNEKIKTLATKEETKTATKAELKAEQDKTEKRLFIGQSQQWSTTLPNTSTILLYFEKTRRYTYHYW